jgi:hypothetical protein
VMQDPTQFPVPYPMPTSPAHALSQLLTLIEDHAPTLLTLVSVLFLLMVAGYVAHWFAARNHITDLKTLFDRFLDKGPKP